MEVNCPQGVHEVNDRTIRRDFELIRELFGDFMNKEGECYQAYNKVPSQKITKKYDNADILAEYTVTHAHELEELLIKCLPKIEVISPLNFKKSLQRRLKQKLSAISRPVNMEK